MRALVFAIDDNYIIPFQVLFNSIHTTNSISSDIEIFILHEKTFSEEGKKALNTYISLFKYRVSFLDAGKLVPAKLPMTDSDHVSRATFYRLFAASIIPKHVTSILYLDIDTVVIRSISKLITMELNKPIAAVDHFAPNETLRLWGWQGGNYFQAGVLIIDLDYWRKNNLELIFLDIMKFQHKRIKWWDQDILNIAFVDNWQRLDVWYNMSQCALMQIDKDIANENSRLIHYDGSQKPWLQNTKRLYKQEWLDAYEKTFSKSAENAWPTLISNLTDMTARFKFKIKNFITRKAKKLH